MHRRTSCVLAEMPRKQLQELASTLIAASLANTKLALAFIASAPEAVQAEPSQLKLTLSHTLQLGVARARQLPAARRFPTPSKLVTSYKTSKPSREPVLQPQAQQSLSQQPTPHPHSQTPPLRPPPQLQPPTTTTTALTTTTTTTTATATATATATCA